MWKKIWDKVADVVTYIAVYIVALAAMLGFTAVVLFALGWIKSMIQ